MSDSPKIFVTRLLPEAVEARLSANFDARLNPRDVLYASKDIIAGAKDCEGLLVSPTEKIDAALIAALPASTKIIATFSVGYDHIDIAAANAAGICVTNTPDVLTDATADLAILLMLGAARGANWGSEMVRNNSWGAWAPTHPLGLDVTGKRLAILGMGRIGQAVAKRARGFDMPTHYHNRTRLDPVLEHGAHYHAELTDLFEVADFLSINCASTPQTRGIVNDKTIAVMPENAIIINTARGDIVDDDSLISALENGTIAAAGLDVFNNEPDIDPRYRHMKNVFCLPHLGSATLQTRAAMGNRAIDNLEQFFNGQTPRDIVGI